MGASTVRSTRKADWVQVGMRVTPGVEVLALVGVAVVGLRTRVELHPVADRPGHEQPTRGQ